MLRVTRRNAALVLPSLEFTMEPRNGGEKNILFMSFFGNGRDDCFGICEQLHRRHRADRYSQLPSTPSKTLPAALEGRSMSGPTRVLAPIARSSTQQDAALLRGGHKHAQMTPLGTSTRRIRAATAGVPDLSDAVDVATSLQPSLPDRRRGSQPLVPMAVRSTVRRRSSVGSGTGDDVIALDISDVPRDEAISSEARRRRLRSSDSGGGSDEAKSAGASSGGAALTFMDDGLVAERTDEEEEEGEAEGASTMVEPTAEPLVLWQSLPPVQPSLWTRVGRMKVLLDIVLPLSPIGASCLKPEA